MSTIEALSEQARAHRDLPPPAVRRSIRESAGLSQDDLARVFDPPIHRETVSRWEAGERTPRGKRLVQYVAILRRLQRIAAA